MLADSAEDATNITIHTRNLVEHPSEDPYPRPEPVPHDATAWVVERSIACPALVPPSNNAFISVIEDRRTVRDISPAPLREVVNAVAFASRPRFLRENDAYFRSLRPSISAGALHPIEIILFHPRGSPRVYQYCPRRHQLNRLPVEDLAALDAFRTECRTVLPFGRGTLLVLIGRPGLVKAHYENHISLYWRD